MLDPAALLARLRGARVVREEEARLRRRYGEPVPVSLTASQIQLEGRPVLHVIARDVTRERRALAELEAGPGHPGRAPPGRRPPHGGDRRGRDVRRAGPRAGPARLPLRRARRRRWTATSMLTWRYLSLPAPAAQRMDRALGQPARGPAHRPGRRARWSAAACRSGGRVHTDQPRRAVEELFGAGGERGDPAALPARPHPPRGPGAAPERGAAGGGAGGGRPAAPQGRPGGHRRLRAAGLDRAGEGAALRAPSARSAPGWRARWPGGPGS